MSILKILTARVFQPLLQPGRYKASWGGRGSGKSHFFGEMMVEACQAEKGMLAVCIREAQKTLAQSSKRLIESKIRSLGLGAGFKSFSDRIETPGDGMIIFRGMQKDPGFLDKTHHTDRATDQKARCISADQKVAASSWGRAGRARSGLGRGGVGM